MEKIQTFFSYLKAEIYDIINIKIYYSIYIYIERERSKFQWERKPISVMKLNLEDFFFVLWLCKLPIHGKIER